MKRSIWTLALALGLTAAAVSAQAQVRSADEPAMQRYVVTPANAGYQNSIQGSVVQAQQELEYALVLANQRQVEQDIYTIGREANALYRVAKVKSGAFNAKSVSTP